MRSPSSLSPIYSPPLFVVTLLGYGNLAIHAVERAACSEKNSCDGEHPGFTEATVEPLTEEREDEDPSRELDSEPGEVGARQSLRRALFRPLFVIHPARKLTACEDFHKQIAPSSRRQPEDSPASQLHETCEVSS